MLQKHYQTNNLITKNEVDKSVKVDKFVGPTCMFKMELFEYKTRQKTLLQQTTSPNIYIFFTMAPTLHRKVKT